jgi:hypothetical protein
LVTPVPLSPLLLLCCAYGGGSIKISLQAMPYKFVFASLKLYVLILKMLTETLLRILFSVIGLLLAAGKMGQN